jgi:hypothetical protein
MKERERKLRRAAAEELKRAVRKAALREGGKVCARDWRAEVEVLLSLVVVVVVVMDGAGTLTAWFRRRRTVRWTKGRWVCNFSLWLSSSRSSSSSSGEQSFLRLTMSWSSCSKLRSLVGGSSWTGQLGALEGEMAKTYPVTQVDGPAEGIVVLDKVVEGTAGPGYLGEVLRVDIFEDVV